MFLILLGIATCVDTLCLKTSAGTECPKDIVATNQVDTVDALIAKILNPGTIIYTAVDIPENKLVDAQIKNIAEIISVKASDAIVTVSYTISSAIPLDSLVLNKITLTAKASTTTAKHLLDGEVVKKLTCKSLELIGGATIDAASDAIGITTLKAASISQAKDIIAMITDELVIVGSNTLITIAPVSKGVKLTEKDSVEVTIPDTFKTVIINSSVTDSAVTFTVSGDFTALTVSVNVNLIYGNQKKTITSLTSATGTVKSDKLKITVNTYYKESTEYSLIAPMITAGATYKLLAEDKRNIPTSAEYCMDKSGERKAYCPVDAQILWDITEFAGINNGKDLINVHIGGYDTTIGDIGHINLLKSLNVRLSGDKGANLAVPVQQKIQIEFDKEEESIDGDFQFENIDLTAQVPSTVTAAKLSCKKLLVEASKIEVTNAAAPASRNLKTGTTTIVVNSIDLTSDVDSLANFDLQKPSKSFSVIDLKSAEFTGDGKSVKLNEKGPFTTESILVPFTIVVPPNGTVAAANPLELKVTKDATQGTSTALPFSIDVQSGAELNVKYEGDWSSNKVIVNVAKGGKFIGKTEGADAKEPNMELQGEGTATINGKDVPRPVVPAAPTDSNKLSGGAIAGIVIACVVVVAAVVVGVFIVLKKKKGKVAN